MTPAEIDRLKQMADGLAVDSRKVNLSCVDLAHKIYLALKESRREGELEMRERAADIFGTSAQSNFAEKIRELEPGGGK